MKKLLTEKELSVVIGRSVSSIQKDRLRDKGAPYIRLGRSIRYRPEDVVNWLEQNRQTPCKCTDMSR
jgi:hypothetical protein